VIVSPFKLSRNIESTVSFPVFFNYFVAHLFPSWRTEKVLSYLSYVLNKKQILLIVDEFAKFVDYIDGQFPNLKSSAWKAVYGFLNTIQQQKSLQVRLFISTLDVHLFETISASGTLIEWLRLSSPPIDNYGNNDLAKLKNLLQYSATHKVVHQLVGVTIF